MKFLLSILLVFSFISCSGSKSKNDVSSEADGVELMDAEEFSEEGESLVDEEISEAAAPQIEINSAEQGVYTVAQNETLMMIAFKIYGDYSQWKVLQEANQAVLNGSTAITTGMQLSYPMPSETFSWNPEGNPYLIKTGDTLGSISDDTYGTTKYWKDVWQNNKPLIKDPNKIFAGFTIYTPVLSARDLATN